MFLESLACRGKIRLITLITHHNSQYWSIFSLQSLQTLQIFTKTFSSLKCKTQMYNSLYQALKQYTSE